MSFHSHFTCLHRVSSDFSLCRPSTLHVDVSFVLRCISMWYPSFTYLGSKRCLSRASEVNSLTRESLRLVVCWNTISGALNCTDGLFSSQGCACPACLEHINISLSTCSESTAFASHCIVMVVSQSQEFLPFYAFSCWAFAPGTVASCGKHSVPAWLYFLTLGITSCSYEWFGFQGQDEWPCQFF